MNLNKELEKYILDHSMPEEGVLQELYRETHVNIYHPRMISGHLQGKILYMICKMINPNKILEIGTYTGYSAICMAYAIHENSKIHTIEINDELSEFTNNYLKKAQVDHKVITYHGDALKIIPDIPDLFDLVFIDGDKKQYTSYFEEVLKKTNKGGFIIADNVLWSGKVIQQNLRNNDHDTHGVIEFNKLIQNDDRVENVMFPVRDGLMIIRKK
jgi:caffeoyl-CoA O-methyltransferase